MDPIIGKPLLVASRVGGQVTLFAVVTADPCSSIQWRVNGSALSGVGYTLNNPCSAPPGSTSFNFTLTITITSARTGTYTAVLINPAGTQSVPQVFVTLPSTSYLNLTDISCSLQFHVIITELHFSHNCLLSGSLVDL